MSTGCVFFDHKHRAGLVEIKANGKITVDQLQWYFWGSDFGSVFHVPTPTSRLTLKTGSHDTNGGPLDGVQVMFCGSWRWCLVKEKPGWVNGWGDMRMGVKRHFPFWGSWEDGFPFPKVGCGLVPWSQECSDVLQKIFHGSSTNPPSLTYIPCHKKRCFMVFFVVEGLLEQPQNIFLTVCVVLSFQTSNFLMEGFHLYLEGLRHRQLGSPSPEGYLLMWKYHAASSWGVQCWTHFQPFQMSPVSNGTVDG